MAAESKRGSIVAEKRILMEKEIQEEYRKNYNEDYNAVLLGELLN